MTDARRRLGARGEQLAARHLKSSGYTILERNYRSSSGEIDIVAEKDRVLVFVEVRTKRTTAFGSPEESITARKRATLEAVAIEYLQEHESIDTDWRIDVVAIRMPGGDGRPKVHVIENAVEL